MTFWNKVQSGVSRAAAEAEKQAKVTRLNFQMGEVQTAIRRKHQELGEAALLLVRDGTLHEPTLDVIVAAIDEDEKRVAELKEQLAEVQAPAPQASA